MMLLVRDVALFGAAVLAAGAALAPRRWESPLEAWCIGMAAAVAVLGAGVLIPYALGLEAVWYVSGYVVLLGSVVLRRDDFARVVADGDVRLALASWSLLTAGCFMLLACVPSFSGGGWMGDWEDQYERTRLFLQVREEDAEFRARFPLTSRPPLINVADAALLWVTGPAFPRHQTFMLLLNSLAYFPAALFCRTLGGGRAAAAWVALCLALNPLFLQNATYPWTKLATVFFVLTALHVLFSAAWSPRRVVTGSILFALGVVTHYSACVWLLALGVPWLLVHRRQWAAPAGRRALGTAVVMFLAVLTPWLAHAIARYGVRATFGSNSTVVDGARFTWQQHAVLAVDKVWSTLVPHPLRTFDHSLTAQTNPWTALRDELFLVYQTNLFFALGTPMLVLFAWRVARRDWPAVPLGRVWRVGVPVVIVLGTVVHALPDPWGLAHICLQPLVVLGIALGAALLPRAFATRGSGWIAGGVLAGWLADFVLGIALHFSATAYQLNRAPGQHLLEYLESLNLVAQHNLWRKVHMEIDAFADQFDVAARHMLLGVVCVALLLVMLGRARLQPSSSRQVPSTHGAVRSSGK